MSRFRALLLLVLVACSAWGSEPAPNAPAPAAGNSKASPSLEDGVFWRENDEGIWEVIFISEEILNNGSWSTLPLKPSEREAVERLFLPPGPPRIDPRGWPYPECVHAFYSVASSGKGAVPFAEFVTRKEVAVLARVLRIMPGWDVKLGNAGSMVELQVEEVFRQTGGWPQAGDRIYYKLDHGSMMIKGRKVCFESFPKTEPPAAGQSLLVVADHVEHMDPRLLYGPAKWPVVGGEIQPQPYKSISDPRPVKLEEIREIFQRSPGETYPQEEED